MITDEHIQALRSFKIGALADRLAELRDSGEIDAMTAPEAIVDLIDTESLAKKNRKIAKLNREARFSTPDACMEDVIYLPQRKLDRDRLERLATGRYIDECDHIVVISKTGCGKSYVVQALGNAACRQGRSVRYIRHSDLYRELNCARVNGDYYQRLDAFCAVDVLIIDDFFLEAANDANTTDIFEIVQAREDKGSLVLASQAEPEQWHQQIKTKIKADAMIDRIVHRCKYIDLEDFNMRKYLSEQKKGH